MKSPFDTLAEEIGAVAGRIERESGLRIAAALADLQRADAERELRFRDLEQRIVERLAALKDGEPGRDGADCDMEAVGAMVETAVAARVAALPPAERGERGDIGPAGPAGNDGNPGESGRDGTDCDMNAMQTMIDAAVSERVSDIPPPEPGAPGRDGADGKDADPAEVAKALHPFIVGELSAEIAKLPPAEPGKDGASVTVDDVAPLIASEVEKAVSTLPLAEPGRDGADCDMEAVRSMVSDEVVARIAEIPPPEPGTPGRDGIDGINGRDGHDVDLIEVTQDGATVELAFTVGDARSIFEFELPEGPAGKDGEHGEKGDPGPVGCLPTVETWAEGVHYEGDVRSHAGGTWQALRDTAKEPPHDDWICIAARGADGIDGQSLNPRRLWEPAEEYKRLDVVALNGGSFVAQKDDPGPCPGDGWMLLTQQGRRGERGEPGAKGDRGERGLPAEPVVAVVTDDEGVLTLTNGDGTKVDCDLYPILAKIAR